MSHTSQEKVDYFLKLLGERFEDISKGKRSAQEFIDDLKKYGFTDEELKTLPKKIKMEFGIVSTTVH